MFLLDLFKFLAVLPPHPDKILDVEAIARPGHCLVAILFTGAAEFLCQPAFFLNQSRP